MENLNTKAVGWNPNGENAPCRVFPSNILSKHTRSAESAKVCGKPTNYCTECNVYLPPEKGLSATETMMLVEAVKWQWLARDGKPDIVGVLYNTAKVVCIGLTAQSEQIILTHLTNFTQFANIPKVIEDLHTQNTPKHANKFPRELSGGHCHRVAIAQALAMKPEILLMDEPANRDNRNTK